MATPNAEYRTHLVGALHDASRDFDQAILTLAAGTLALSVTFAHDIAPTPKPDTTWFLLVAWTALAAALVTIVISLLSSQLDLRNVIGDLDDEKADAGRNKRWAARVTTWLNAAGGAGLVVGLVFLGLYALNNL